MENNKNGVVKKNASEHLAPSGRGWHAVPGEGVLNKEHFMGTPSSPLWGTSPARGEVNGGFTLIELLVVVLIIGILAAVAVPQYQKAVEKSRMTEAQMVTSSVQKAVEEYLLMNGIPSSGTVELMASSSDEKGKVGILSVSMEENLDCTTKKGYCLSKSFGYDAYCTSNGCWVRAKRYLTSDVSDIGSHYIIQRRYWSDNGVWKWKNQCQIYGNLGGQVCPLLEMQGWEITDYR